MNFELSEDQRAFAEMASGLFADFCSDEQLRAQAAALAARAPDGSHLVGSAITMGRSRINLREGLGLNDSECRALLYDNPRRLIAH